MRAGRQLDSAGPEADGVVASDLARVAAAEDEGEGARGAIRVGVIRGLILHGLPDAMRTSLLFLFALCLLRCAAGASLQCRDSLLQGAHALAQLR
jgi:hypothetical protein